MLSIVDVPNRYLACLDCGLYMPMVFNATKKEFEMTDYYRDGHYCHHVWSPLEDDHGKETKSI